MKTVLTALNARYSHSSLALRYLKQYNKEFDISLKEFTINDQAFHIFEALYEEKAHVYGFSCYIWNIEQTLKVAQMLKKALPKAWVFLGGPEVSYNPQAFLKKHPFLDFILVGEGEEALKGVLSKIEKGETDLAEVPGAAVAGQKHQNPMLPDLATMPQPYTKEDLHELSGKMVYFETSRGCPFHCAYCLSSKEHTVRPFPMDYVKKGLSLFFEHDVPLVKLIDRTFNYDSKRCVEILEFILKNSCHTRVHMELEPRILTPEIIALLGNAPAGMFQVEMGIQSANEEALRAVNRAFDREKTKKHIEMLRAYKTVHIHLDLIAGLPFEDYESFGKSFDYVYQMKPHMLQLGFLKVLSGTSLAEHEDIVAADFPPYEVIATKWLSAKDIIALKMVEEAVELFYNSGAFPGTIARLTQNTDHPFAVFEALGRMMKEAETKGKKKRKDWYEALFEVYGEEIRHTLSEDFIRHNKSIPLPDFTLPKRERGFKDKAYALMKDPAFCEKYQVEFDLKNLRFERMNKRGYMMDYATNRLFDITEEIEEDACQEEHSHK